MIADIFLPERYGAYFLLSRRVASVMITKSSVRVAVVRSVRTQRFIEQLIEEVIDQDLAMPFAERVSIALQKALSNVPASVHLTVIVPSPQLIFKMITVPKMALEKVKLIVPFEVEALLPFPWADAAIDCIITHEDAHENKVHVLVMATTKAILNEQRSYFTAIGKTPAIMTTSALALCGLSQDLPQFFDAERPVITLCIDQHETIILLAYQNRILALRSLAQGLYDVFMGEEFKKEALKEFIHNIVSTAFSFLEQTGNQSSDPKLIVCGIGAEHKELCESLQQEWSVACELVPINKILHTGTIVSHSGMTNAFLLPIAAALPHALTDDVNLDRDSAEKTIYQKILWQLGGATLLLAAIFGSFFLTRTLVLRSMRASFSKANQHMVAAIEHNIDGLQGRLKGRSLDYAIREAEREIAKNNIWFSLGGSNRFAALRVLLELSKKLNRESLGLQLRRLDFEYAPQEEKEKLVLEGKVKDDKAVLELEKNLSESPMFTLSESLQKPEFTVHLKLNLNSEEF